MAYTPDRGDIVHLQFDPASGRDQQRQRPLGQHPMNPRRTVRTQHRDQPRFGMAGFGKAGKQLEGRAHGARS